MTDEVELSHAERDALAALKKPIDAPTHVERQVVAGLRARRMLRSPASRSIRVAAVAAVVCVAFASGAFFDRAVNRPHGSASRFMLLLYGGDGGDSSRRGEYARWARGIAETGVEISGEELSEASAEVPALAWPDRAAQEAQPRGYFVVSTRNLDDARRIAASCPHVQHGGRIAIRQIVAAP